MTRVHIVGPATPNPGEYWCAACVMLAKQAVHDEHGAEMSRLSGDGRDGVKVYVVPSTAHLNEAVTIGIWGDFPQLPTMPVCWTHAAGVKAQSPLAAGLGNGGPVIPPPGFVKGRG